MSNIAPHLDDPQATRIIQKLLDRISKLEQAQEAQRSKPKHTEGKEGDLRVVRNAAGHHHIEVRSDKGWHKTDDLTLSTKQE